MGQVVGIPTMTEMLRSLQLVISLYDKQVCPQADFDTLVVAPWRLWVGL